MRRWRRRLPATQRTRVNLPRRLRHNAKRLKNEALAESRVVEHVHKRRAGFVVHGPASVDELELARCDEALHGGLLGRRLLRPPARKEGLLHFGKLAVGVLEKRRDGGAEDAVNVGVLNRIVCAVVVLVHCLQPACKRRLEGGWRKQRARAAGENASRWHRAPAELVHAPRSHPARASRTDVVVAVNNNVHVDHALDALGAGVVVRRRCEGARERRERGRERLRAP